MVKSENEKWKEKCGVLSKEYYREREKTNRLIASIRWLLTKDTQLKFDIAKHGQKYAEKFKMMDTLFDRLKLMDITECCTHQNHKNIRKCNGKGLVQIINNLEANAKKLKSIDDEMMLLISDVHDLHSYIEYVKHSKVAKVKLISLLRGINWNAGKSRPNVPAMPARKKPMESLPNFMPDMYHYLYS